MLFSRILLDLVGRKTSGQKGTDSIKCGQVQGTAFCDKHIKPPSPVLDSAWSATVLAKDLEILLHLDSSPRLLAKRLRESRTRILKKEHTLLEVSSWGSPTCRAPLCHSVPSWRRPRGCKISLAGKAKRLTLQSANVRAAGGRAGNHKWCREGGWRLTHEILKP